MRVVLAVVLLLATALMWWFILSVWVDAAGRAISPVSSVSAAMAWIH